MDAFFENLEILIVMTMLLKNWVISSTVNPKKTLFKNSETELFKTSKIIKIGSWSSENEPNRKMH